MEAISQKNEGRIITVHPVTGGNGANYIAVNLAYALREKDPYTRIAIVDFDFTNPHLALSLTTDNVHGIDNLVDKINGRFLDTDMFKENMITLKEEIHLLKGTQLGRFNLVKQTHLKEIVTYLRALYDVVIISTSHDVSDGGTVTALNEADNILVVARYNEVNALVAEKTVENVQTYQSESEVGVVYNYYHNENGLDFTEVFDEFETFGNIPYLNETVDNQHLSGNVLSGLKRRKNTTQEVYHEILTSFIED